MRWYSGYENAKIFDGRYFFKRVIGEIVCFGYSLISLQG